MATPDSERVKRVKKRWAEEKKIAGGDVAWLIERAEKTDTMLAAEEIRKLIPYPKSPFSAFGL